LLGWLRCVFAKHFHAKRTAQKPMGYKSGCNVALAIIADFRNWLGDKSDQRLGW